MYLIELRESGFYDFGFRILDFGFKTRDLNRTRTRPRRRCASFDFEDEDEDKDDFKGLNGKSLNPACPA